MALLVSSKLPAQYCLLRNYIAGYISSGRKQNLCWVVCHPGFPDLQVGSACLRHSQH